MSYPSHQSRNRRQWQQVWRIALSIGLLVLMWPQPVLPANAQAESDCGIVDAIDYPVAGISREHDDFGMYRITFKGYHTGIDMAFDRPGEPIRAAARGRVTFSDIAGWDTEKGVVIIEHRFPDNSVYFTLYGHMEESETVKFPAVNACVALGDVIGVVGRPSLSAPHLHYEVRRMRASTGGPGYWLVDPLDGGWSHPIEFTELWKVRLNHAFRAAIVPTTALAIPPLTMADGSTYLAEQNFLEQRDAAGNSLWRMQISGLVGIAPTADGNVLGRTQTNQLLVMGGGRFIAAWNADRGLRTPPIKLDDTYVFVTDDDVVIGYGTDGTIRWQVPLNSRMNRYSQSGNLLAIAALDNGSNKLWVIDAAGTLLYQGTAPAPITPVGMGDGSFLILVATQIASLGPDAQLRTLMDVGQVLTRNSQLARTDAGSVVLYPGTGNQIYAYQAEGKLIWQANLPQPQAQPPLIAVGAGCLAYVLTADGTLSTFNMTDGRLAGQIRLYTGGSRQNFGARFLRVLPNEQVQLSAGYLSVVTLDGPTLGQLGSCAAP